MVHSVRLGCAATLLLLAAGASAQAPEDGQTATIRTSVREVVVDLVVHDRHGKPVRKLDPKDVALYEDGVRQEIRSLRLVGGQEMRREDAKPAAPPASPASGPPPLPAAKPSISPLRTVSLVCLVFQDLGPDTRKMAFDAALEFLKGELRPNTIVGVFSLDDAGVHPMARFTSNREALVKGIQMASAGQIPAVGASQDLFTAMGLDRPASMSPPSLPAQAGGAGQQPPATSVGFQQLGAAIDASTDVGEGADIARNPLGRDQVSYQRVVAMRELHALGWLVAQLTRMPFRKTVLLFSPGLSRPESEVDYWRTLLKTASAANIGFYVLEITGPTTISPLAAQRAGVQRAAALSRSQGQPLPAIGGLSAEMDRARQNDVSDYAVATANAHAMLVDLAESTGGFLITDGSPRMLARVMDDAQTHYELTYRPAAENYDGRFHKIEVKLAREDLRVEARNGYFAVPATADGSPISPEEAAGLRALDSTPLPHAFDYRAQALHFRAPGGPSEFAITLDIPMANLTATADPAQKKHRLHASFLALVKDSNGQIVRQLGADSPLEVPDGEIGSVPGGRLSFERPVTLAAGHYKVETAVVDWEAGRASTAVLEIDSAGQRGPELSSLTLVRRVEDVSGSAGGSDPLEYQGRRVVPSLFADLPPDTTPYVFFRVYPDPSNPAPPLLRAQMLRDGRLVQDQTSEIPAPDDSGSIPVLIEAAAHPGSHELRLTVSQGSGSSRQRIEYTITAK